jgi:hypothetical protein
MRDDFGHQLRDVFNRWLIETAATNNLPSTLDTALHRNNWRHLPQPEVG